MGFPLKADIQVRCKWHEATSAIGVGGHDAQTLVRAMKAATRCAVTKHPIRNYDTIAFVFREDPQNPRRRVLRMVLFAAVRKARQRKEFLTRSQVVAWIHDQSDQVPVLADIHSVQSGGSPSSRCCA